MKRHRIGCEGPTRRQVLASAGQAALGVVASRFLGCAEENWPFETCQPVGSSVAPRVVRIWDPQVADWNFSAGAGDYTEHIDGERLAAMLARSVTELTGETGARDGWLSLLGRVPDEDRVAIKVNLNAVDNDQERRLNNSVEMMCALLTALTDAGVRQDRITLFDASRGFPERIRSRCRELFPDASYLGGGEVPLHDEEVISAGSMPLPDGAGALAVPLPRPVVEADHFINLHLLKGHHGGGTGAMKNLFGMARNVWNSFHGSQHGWSRWEHGRQCGELCLNEQIRTKTRLLVSEGLYGTHWNADTVPDRFQNEDLFPGGRPCSVLVSHDPVAQDSVIYDLCYREREVAEVQNNYPDTWLRNAAEDGAGLHEHGRYVAGEHTEMDLEYCNIDYRSARL